MNPLPAATCVAALLTRSCSFCTWPRPSWIIALAPPTLFAPSCASVAAPAINASDRRDAAAAYWAWVDATFSPLLTVSRNASPRVRYLSADGSAPAFKYVPDAKTSSVCASVSFSSTESVAALIWSSVRRSAVLIPDVVTAATVVLARSNWALAAASAVS